MPHFTNTKFAAEAGRQRGAVPGPRTGAERGFSILELVAVLAVISCLIFGSTPVWNYLIEAQSVTAGAHELASMVEAARKEAIARQTYVWIGFKTVEQSGQKSIVAAAVYSQDGSGSNMDPSNLIPMQKALRISRAGLLPRSEMGEALLEKLPATAASPLGNSEGISFQRGKQDFSGDTITITPRGEILLKGNAGPYDGYVPQLELGFTQMRGGSVPANAQQVALLIDGAQGAVQIIRDK